MRWRNVKRLQGHLTNAKDSDKMRVRRKVRTDVKCDRGQSCRGQENSDEQFRLQLTSCCLSVVLVHWNCNWNWNLSPCVADSILMRIKLKHFVAAFRYLILRLGTIFFIAYVYSFKISLTHPLPSIIYSPFHVIRLSSRLRTATRFPRPVSCTKNYCFFINYALNHYQVPSCNS